VGLLPDGRVVSGSRDKTIKVWDLRAGTCTATINLASMVSCLGVLPDGKVVVGEEDRKDFGVKLYDVDREKCIAELPGHTAWVKCVGVFRKVCVCWE